MTHAIVTDCTEGIPWMVYKVARALNINIHGSIPNGPQANRVRVVNNYDLPKSSRLYPNLNIVTDRSKILYWNIVKSDAVVIFSKDGISSRTLQRYVEYLSTDCRFNKRRNPGTERPLIQIAMSDIATDVHKIHGELLKFLNNCDAPLIAGDFLPNNEERKMVYKLLFSCFLYTTVTRGCFNCKFSAKLESGLDTNGQGFPLVKCNHEGSVCYKEHREPTQKCLLYVNKLAD